MSLLIYSVACGWTTDSVVAFELGVRTCWNNAMKRVQRGFHLHPNRFTLRVTVDAAAHPRGHPIQSHTHTQGTFRHSSKFNVHGLGFNFRVWKETEGLGKRHGKNMQSPPRKVPSWFHTQYLLVERWHSKSVRGIAFRGKCVVNISLLIIIRILKIFPTT